MRSIAFTPSITVFKASITDCGHWPSPSPMMVTEARAGSAITKAASRFVNTITILASFRAFSASFNALVQASTSACVLLKSVSASLAAVKAALKASIFSCGYCPSNVPAASSLNSSTSAVAIAVCNALRSTVSAPFINARRASCKVFKSPITGSVIALTASIAVLKASTTSCGRWPLSVPTLSFKDS